MQGVLMKKVAHPVCIVWWRWLPLHAGIQSSPWHTIKAMENKWNEYTNEVSILSLLYQCVVAGSAVTFCRWRWTNTKSTHELLMCTHMCSYCLCSVCCPSTRTLTCQFCPKSPCFWRDYIPALKMGKIAFPTLLLPRVMGSSCQGSVGRGRKRKHASPKVPFPWKWWQTEQRRRDLTRWLAVCTPLHPVDITGTDTHPVMTHSLIN